jgi:hypothetical protein
MTIANIHGSAIASRGVARVGANQLHVTGMSQRAVGRLHVTRVSVGGDYLSDVLLASLVTAIGLGLAFVPVTIAAVAGVSRAEAGLASGLVNTSRQMGGALGLAILATVAATTTRDELAERTAPAQALTDGFHHAFAFGAGFAVLGALVALFFLPRVRPPRTPAPVSRPEPVAEG